MSKEELQRALRLTRQKTLQDAVAESPIGVETVEVIIDDFIVALVQRLESGIWKTPKTD